MIGIPTLSKGITTRPNKRGWVHPMLKETAIGFAEAMYERLAALGTPDSNLWYQQNLDRAVYVRTAWPDLIPKARATLAHMLTIPQYSEDIKGQISQALIDDNNLRAGRASGQMNRMKRIGKIMQNFGRK